LKKGASVADLQVEKLKSALKKMNVFPDVERIKPEEDLFSAGALDSLTLIQFVLVLEDSYKIRIENSDITYERFQSFNKIASLLKDKYRQ
jgi:acyl carrier protein